MRMPEPSWFTYELVDRTLEEVRAVEYEVSVMLPWRRYNPNAQPRVMDESPSEVSVGRETRFGAELSLRRLSYGPHLSHELVGEMLGELAECWTQMTSDQLRISE